MPIALIAAYAGAKRVIGKDGDLPWHFPSDLKFFKETTMGHAVLMGRVTYDSIIKRLGKPLPGRKNIVVTRDKNYKDERAEIIHGLSSLIQFKNEKNWLFVIGGAQIFKETLPMADRLYLTHIDKEYEGDVFFPPIDSSEWELSEQREVHENGVPLRFCTYDRVKA